MHPRLIVYFDGLCPLCSREIAQYQKRCPVGKAEFLDICAGDFIPEQHGLDPVAIHQTLHARLDGELHTGVDAFLAIWKIVPGFRLIGTFVSLPGINWLAGLMYAGFSRLRPWLPRRKNRVCELQSCRTRCSGGNGFTAQSF